MGESCGGNGTLFFFWNSIEERKPKSKRVSSAQCSHHRPLHSAWCIVHFCTAPPPPSPAPPAFFYYPTYQYHGHLLSFITFPLFFFIHCPPNFLHSSYPSLFPNLLNLPFPHLTHPLIHMPLFIIYLSYG